MKKLLLFIFVLPLFCSAQNKPYLNSGVYYISEKPTKVRMCEIGYNGQDSAKHSFYINPKPIVTAQQFKRVDTITHPGSTGFSIHVTLTDAGRKILDTATKRIAKKQIALVIRNQLICTPVVIGEIKVGMIDYLFVRGDGTVGQATRVKKELEQDMNIK